VHWHLIGHLQRNKVRVACELFDCIHSVDSLPLAQDIERRAAQQGIVMPVLIQINIGAETTKSGAALLATLPLIQEVAVLSHVAIRGLMCIPPASEDPEAVRPYFAQLRALAEDIDQRHLPKVAMTELSMGMSHDFEVAIEEGATMVRVGSAIFGPRPD
jgi:hypothetical protein